MKTMKEDKILQLDAKSLLESRLAESLGLDRYALIMQQARKVNIAIDEEFQHTFNAFYRVRKNAAWRAQYYTFFERAKKENLGYAEILMYLYSATGNIEASFASKMVATINPDSPIIDQYVLQNLGIAITGPGKDMRLKTALSAYSQLTEWYEEYLQKQEAKDNIAAFDKMLPSYAWISDTKKIDYLLWIKR